MSPSLRYNCSAINLTNTVTPPSGAEISMAPTDREQRDVPEKVKRAAEEMLISKVLPEYSQGKEAHHWRMCWDAQTPTEDWLMCGYPDGRVEGLYLAVEGSFHGYKFLPNFGKYMRNVLDGKGNSEERDKAWGWKSGKEWEEAREQARARRREIGDLDAECGQVGDGPETSPKL